MICKIYYRRIIIRVILLALNALLLFWIIFFFPNVSLIILTGLLFLFQVVSLIRYLNKINQKLELFFLAYLSGDVTSLKHSLKSGSEFDKLQEYFTRINDRLEKIRVENEIRNTYFKTIVDQTNVGLISFTQNGTVEFINDEFRKIFNCYVVRNLTKLDNYKDGLSEFLKTLEPERSDLISVVIQGELIPLSVKKREFKVGDKLLHLVSLQNIKAELDQKEMESWQKLIRVLTHEIMNSITPIISLVNTISRIFKDRETGQIVDPKELTPAVIDKTVRGLDIIEGRGKGLVDFVRNFRDVNKLPKPQFQVVNVRKLLQETKMLFDEFLEQKQVEIVISCQPSLLVQADQKLLEQVLINLVKNALEACQEKPNSKVTLSAHTTLEHTYIQVEDNGKGIPDVVMENIFVPFFTTKEKGSGIGLSLSRQIIRMHGGTLDFISVPGEKTIFTIKL
ncbi:MAG: ATP-binding protein [Bacteroidales bacterium]|nr:ATP-binding protein [Bacteroidales bacterium]